jgi:hypothetical protein
MQVTIQECPGCGAVVMGDEQVCSGCGKPLPKTEAASPATDRTMQSPAEESCPRCGSKVPRGVLRCRDCGSYMNPEVEAAAMAQQASRMFTPGGSSGGLLGRGAAFGSSAYNQGVSPVTSSFAEVADDADFDLVPELDLKAQDIDEVMHQRETTGEEDDFEMGDGTGASDYSVAGGSEAEDPAPAAAPIPDLTAAPGEAPAAEAPAPSASPGAPPIPAVDHSVSTGGDVLLDAALAEQAEAAKRAKFGRRRPKRRAITALSSDRILVFCPNGHRIQVQDRHRGRTGRCPNCRALFFVPLPATAQTLGEAGGQPAEAAAAGAAAPAAPAPVGYTKWIADVRLHRVNPAKLKLVPDSLAGDYETADLGASAENLLMAVVFAGSGPFRSMQEPKKKPATRQAMLSHLQANKPLEELPVPKKYLLTPEMLTQLKIVQPAVPGEESLFADVPVFGKGRIALRVAVADGTTDRAYLSFTLSQFREFSQVLNESFALADYGTGTPIPLTDTITDATCHYSDTVMHTLASDHLEYYQADPAIKLVVLGRRCAKCGLVVSEDSRKKEKIGAKTDASVAKALCPKCKSKFGNITLYGLPAT